MGRPKLSDVRKIDARVPVDWIMRMDALVGPHRRPMVIRSAIERELIRVEALVRKADRKAFKEDAPPE